MTHGTTELELLENAVRAAAAELQELGPASRASQGDLEGLLADAREELGRARARVALLEEARARDAALANARLTAALEGRSAAMTELLGSVERAARRLRDGHARSSHGQAEAAQRARESALLEERLAAAERALETHARQSEAERASLHDERAEAWSALETAITERDAAEREGRELRRRLEVLSQVNAELDAAREELADTRADLARRLVELAEVQSELEALRGGRDTRGDLREELARAKVALEDLRSRLVQPTVPPTSEEAEASGLRTRKPTPVGRLASSGRLTRSATTYSVRGSDLPTEHLGSPEPPHGRRKSST